jgi:ATP-dependent RNA helicase DeaD
LLSLDDLADPVDPVFRDLGLREPVLTALDALGFEKPTPIQAQMIPPFLAGRDILGQAQTGTGKTAAFALPILSRLDLDKRTPRALVLTPTRELAIQVADAFEQYARCLKGFQVVPIYGGQEMGGQLRRLARGVHVVVGTPGRVMDHLRRGSLNLADLECLVLDEADEMLRMGFIDDVTWILEQTPDGRQIALMSATLPPPIRRIAAKHLLDPVSVTIAARTTTVEATRQRYCVAREHDKFGVLARILEAEDFDAALIFVRTRTATLEVAERLKARGFAVAPLSSDIAQKQREKTVARLKAGKLDVLVATDVAARGLDLDRITHVVNFDIPNDLGAYVHRIGRTGRAGRNGEAILLVTPREQHLLRDIERGTRQRLEPLALPSLDDVNARRIERFKQRIADALGRDDLAPFRAIVDEFANARGVPPLDVAAALARLAQGDRPLLLDDLPVAAWPVPPTPRSRAAAEPRRPARPDGPEPGMVTYRVEVGRGHGVAAGHIVGAIANEGGIESRYIGRITIHHDHSTVDLPEGMPDHILHRLRGARVYGEVLNISREAEVHPASRHREPRHVQVRPHVKPKRGK